VVGGRAGHATPQFQIGAEVPSRKSLQTPRKLGRLADLRL